MKQELSERITRLGAKIYDDYQNGGEFIRLAPYRYCLRKEDVEDILQNVLIKIITRGPRGKIPLESYRGYIDDSTPLSEDRQLSRWLKVSLANACRSYQRCAYFKRTRNHISLFDLEPVSKSTDPLNLLISMENEKILTDYLSALPLHYKEVVSLRCQDASYKEISKRLGIPMGTVKSRMNTIRKGLVMKVIEQDS